jgi:uncharacterized protein YecE (DUF72 family)
VTATQASVPGLYVGTSGFSYPSWRGGFYAADARPEEFLRHYAARLPTVELNNTFYRLPAEEQFARWAAETPPGFRFAVTMSRRVTARGRVEGVDTFAQSARLLGDRLGPIRIKVPQARDDGFLLLLLGSLEPDLLYTLDFRHPSWDDPAVTARLDEHAKLERLASAVSPILADGVDVYAYFRHEDEPTAPQYARRLTELVGSR